MSHPDFRSIEACLLALLAKRAPAASICPSDVARALEQNEAGWRALMPQVRRVAARLAEEGAILITQGDREVAPEDIDFGPVRFRRGPKFQEGS